MSRVTHEFCEDYRFTGKEDDVEVGLIYFGARYYAPLLGIWISADPLAVHSPGEADLNLYAYVQGRVLVAVDPVGFEPYGYPRPEPSSFARMVVEGFLRNPLVKRHMPISFINNTLSRISFSNFHFGNSFTPWIDNHGFRGIKQPAMFEISKRHMLAPKKIANMNIDQIRCVWWI